MDGGGVGGCVVGGVVVGVRVGTGVGDDVGGVVGFGVGCFVGLHSVSIRSSQTSIRVRMPEFFVPDRRRCMPLPFMWWAYILYRLMTC